MCTRQAIFSRKLIVLCQLWWISRGGMFNICRAIYCYPSQINSIDSRDLFIYECRQRLEPEEPYVQTWTHSPGDNGKRFQNNQRLISSVAGPHRSLHSCNGPTLSEYGYFISSF